MKHFHLLLPRKIVLPGHLCGAGGQQTRCNCGFYTTNIQATESPVATTGEVGKVGAICSSQSSLHTLGNTQHVTLTWINMLARRNWAVRQTCPPKISGAVIKFHFNPCSVLAVGQKWSERWENSSFPFSRTFSHWVSGYKGFGVGGWFGSSAMAEQKYWMLSLEPTSRCLATFRT
jgi:hypothetical protein